MQKKKKKAEYQHATTHVLPNLSLVIHLCFNVLPDEQVGKRLYPKGHRSHLEQCGKVSLTCYCKNGLSGRNPLLGHHLCNSYQYSYQTQLRKVVMHTSCVYVVGCVSLSPSIIFNNTQRRVLSKISYVIVIQTVTRKLNCMFYILTISISTAIVNFLQESLSNR